MLTSLTKVDVKSCRIREEQTMCSLVVRRFSEMHRHFRHPEFEFHNRFGLMRLIGCLVTFALIIIDVTSNKCVH